MYNKLQQDMVAAMKNRETEKRDLTRILLAAIKKAAIDEQCEITDELANRVILKEAKTLQEQLDTCPADRVEMYAQYKTRMMYMQEYMPKLLDDPVEIKSIVESLLAAAGIEPVKSNKGAAMKVVMPNFKGKADMKIVNQVIAEMLI